MDHEALRELLQARLTAARLQQMAIVAEIKALEDQLDALAAMQGTPPSAVWDVKAAPTHNIAIMSVLLNTQDALSPKQISQTIRDAGREPPSQISFYVDQLCKKKAIRKVAYAQYRPGVLNLETRPFFPDGYTGEAAPLGSS